MTDEAVPSSVPDVAELVDELKRRVAERRRTGQYPTEVTTDLRAHFERIKRHRPVSNLEFLAAQLDALDALGWFSADKIVLSSAKPGVQQMNSVVARLVSRQTLGILEQVQLFGDAVREALRTVLTALEEPHGHVHDELLGQVDALHEQVADLRRGPESPLGAIAELRARVEAVEGRLSSGRFPPIFDRDRFERLRSEDDSERLRSFAGKFEACAPVLDVGLGQGGFLAVLEELGIEARGVEADRALAHLLTTADGSLGGIALVLGAEHLSVHDVAQLASLAYDKVRSGGRVVVHTTPLHPAYLRMLFEDAGFVDVRVETEVGAPEDYVLVSTR